MENTRGSSVGRAPLNYSPSRGLSSSQCHITTENKPGAIASVKGGIDGETGIVKHDGGRAVRTPPSRPITPFCFRWNEPLGLPDAPYMHRYMINLWLFSIRVHVWHRSDDKRFMHNHAFNFLTIVLKGGYIDAQEGSQDVMKAGSIRYRKANHTHFVGWPIDPTVTLLFCGRKKQNWGFKVKNKIMRPLRFFSRYGHPSTDEK